MIFKLNENELRAYKDHERRIVLLSNQINELLATRAREIRDLEFIWTAGYRRYLIETGQVGSVPYLFGSDGNMNIAVNDNGEADWLPGRLPAIPSSL